MPLVTLLTDFGLGDPYVGEMKGVLLRLAPGTSIVDVTHGIRPGAIREGAWVLSRVWASFPDGTCHVVVVDPGVGSGRRGLVVSAGGHRFVGPDNGLLQAAFEPPGAEIREIALRELEHVRRGTTFDGRDVFAPAAARLVLGAGVGEFGPEVTDPVSLAPFRPVRHPGGGFVVEIVRTDRFGNLVTPLEEGFLREVFAEDWRSVAVIAGKVRLQGVKLAYTDVEPAEGVLTIGGAGTLEISVRDGNARKRLGLDAGDTVILEGPVDTG